MDNKNLWPGWETVRIIGRGSYGAVYEIERELYEGEKEKAALKVISIPHNESEVNALRTEGLDDQSITKVFEGQSKEIIKEYALMRKLSGHTNIVDCHEFRHVQQEDGLGWDVFIRMELLKPFTSVLGGTIEEKQVVAVGKDLCQALILCRKYNIVHRDIKPQNIFVSDTGDYKLGDFGIARTMEQTSGATSIGSPNYMAPEVAKGLDYGNKADIYSLGLVLYWMLNERRLPFLPLPPKLPTHHDNKTALNRRLSGEIIPAPKNGSDALKTIVLKACAYDSKDRYNSADEMLAALNTLSSEPVIVPPQPDNDADEDTTIITKPESSEEDTIITKQESAKDEPIVELKPDMPKTEPVSLTEESVKPKKKWIIPAICLAAIGLLIAGVTTLLGKQEPQENQVSAETKAQIVTIDSDSLIARDYEVGDRVLLGSFEQDGDLSNGPEDIEWIVLERTASDVLLVSSKILHAMPYNLLEAEDNYWDLSLMRRWLNTTFLETAFTEDIKAQITATECGNGIFEPCYDKVVLLSMSEADRCLKTDDLRIAEPTNYALGEISAFQLDVDPVWRCSTYWLRSEEGDRAIDGNGSHVMTGSLAGVRPALRLSVDGTVIQADELGFKAVNESYGINWDNVVDVSEGWTHVVGLKANGTVVARCVMESTTSNWEGDVSGWTDIIDVAAGNGIIVGLKADGTAVATGKYEFSDEKIDVTGWEKLRAIYANEGHAVGLRYDGHVYASGANDNGQCDISNWSDIVSVSLGANFTVGLQGETGAVFCTDPDFDLSDWPSNIVDIAAGDDFILGLNAERDVYISYRNEYGDLDVSGWTDIKQIAAGELCAAALTLDGKVLSSGVDIEYYNNGDGHVYAPGSGIPNPGCMTSEWSGIIQVCAGWYCIGLRVDGTVVASDPYDWTFTGVSELENVRRVYPLMTDILTLQSA